VQRGYVPSGSCEEIEFQFFAGDKKCVTKCQTSLAGHLTAKLFEAQAHLFPKNQFLHSFLSPICCPDLYGIEKFTYVPEENYHLCPAGKPLNYVGINKRNRAHRGTTQATKSGGSVLGTEEPDWIAAPAATQNQVRA
jgi:hypothetical protein